MLELLQSRSGLIAAVLGYEHRVRETVVQFKAIAVLVDGTRLHINEVWARGELRKYAYYLVTPTDEVILGWDNAPHHPEVATYPVHLHYAGNVYPSQVRSLSYVLDLIAQGWTPDTCA